MKNEQAPRNTLERKEAIKAEQQRRKLRKQGRSRWTPSA